MLKSIIQKINKEFLEEANNSPKLLEDMAAMEEYMAESYGQRIFIELLQNADDADSKNVKVVFRDNHLYFANDGRAFNENDIVNISRSGSSNKQRGKNIGYRGIGFKSTSYLTNNILIYSKDTCFSFSKERCASELGILDINKVPTIRIPFLVKKDELQQKSPEIINTIDELVRDGYQTIFIFTNSNSHLIKEEIDELNNGYFLFLRNLTSADINFNDNKIKKFNISRNHVNEQATIISIKDESKDNWLIVNDKNYNNISLAFKLNEKNLIIPCNGDEALFHCFLPTLEKTGFPFKINSDFTTDPSRKHLTYDKETEKCLVHIASMIFKLIREAINENNEYIPLFSLLMNKTEFNKFSLRISNELKQLIINNKWIKLSNGDFISPIEYKRSPKWLESSELNIIRKNSHYISKFSLPLKVYKSITDIDLFLEKFSLEDYSDSDWTCILSEVNFIKKTNPQLIGKIFGKITKNIRFNKKMNNKNTDFEKILIPFNENPIVITELKNKNDIKLDTNFEDGFMQVALVSDLEEFDKKFDTNLSTSIKAKIVNKEKVQIKTKKITNHVSKWRAAEQQCIEIEEMFGNNALDVSKQNLGYDVESKSPEGNLRYIEVKSISNNANEFTMTNNEYTAAHQYKENYYLCIIRQREEGIDVTYIQNPIHTIKLEKRVRQWEWYCNGFSGEKYNVMYR